MSLAMVLLQLQRSWQVQCLKRQLVLEELNLQGASLLRLRHLVEGSSNSVKRAIIRWIRS